MALDGIFLNLLTEELGCIVGCHIDKIHQPSRDELVFLLRSKDFSGRLLISAKSGFSRIHITTQTFENPADPPTFCKLMRKHLGNSKIEYIRQFGLDRVVEIGFSSYNELGDRVYPRLIVELFSNRSNIILCNEFGKITDAIHRSDIESSARLIQPGAQYVPLIADIKADISKASSKEILFAISTLNKPLYSALTASIDGLSPLVAREICFKAFGDFEIIASELDGGQRSLLQSCLNSFKEIKPLPHLITTADGETKEFSFIPITHYGPSYKSEVLPSYSLLLEEFYGRRSAAADIKHKAQDIYKLLSTLITRTERKMAYRLEDLRKCSKREQKRIFGELLKANLYAIEKGASSVTLDNWYDENCSKVTIPLNPALSPAANAAKYFKEYKKAHTAEQLLNELIIKDKKELAYLDSVLDSLTRASTSLELDELREELFEAGYIRRTVRSRRKVAQREPLKFSSPDGFCVLVGRNNRENDLLTTKIADKRDIWLHTKNIPGSHVIIITEGKEVPESTLFFAARLARDNSKASGGTNVPVDYTPVKFVKKPAGALPGMVIYTTNKTIYV